MHPGKRVFTLLIGLGVWAGSPVSGMARPGDRIAFIPSNFAAPFDIAHDNEDGTFWVCSALDKEIYHLGADLTERLDPIPIPFEPAIFSFVLGIAYNSRDRTLLVLDSAGRRIHEIEKDGTPTRVIPIPPEIEGELNGMAHDPDGDGGAGSIYLADHGGKDFHGNVLPGFIHELSMDGAPLRRFPEADDPGRFFGKGPASQPRDVDLIREDGKLIGFYVSTDTDGILRFNREGEFTGDWVSTAQAGGSVSGFLHRPFPHPVTGRVTEMFICVVGTEARFALLEDGADRFPEVTRFACEQTGRAVRLEWMTWKDYDLIEVLDGCDVLRTLPGDATDWQGTLDVDGVHSLSVRAVSSSGSASSTICIAVVGTGQILRQTELDIDTWALTSDGRQHLMVTRNRAREILVLDFDFQPQGFIPVSAFFAADGDFIAALAYDETTDTVFLYNHTQNRIARIDFSLGEHLGSFNVLLPHLDAPERKRPAVGGMTFFPAGSQGSGSLVLVDRVRDVIYEVDLSGKVLRELPHPYRTLDEPIPDPLFGPFTGGISMVAGGGPTELYLSGGRSRENGQRRIFRWDIESGRILEGADITTAALRGGFFSIQHVNAGGRSRIFALKPGDPVLLYEVQTDLPPVASPSFLTCSQTNRDDHVELRFTPRGPYNRVEIFRDCEKIAEIGGARDNYVDQSAEPGVHLYAVRGVRGGQASEFARCQLRVGVGAILERASTWPVQLTRLMTRDPADGSYYTDGKIRLEDDRLSDSMLHQFDADFGYVKSREFAVEPASIASFAVRVTPAGERLLCLLITENQTDQVFLRSETLEGAFFDDVQLSPPRPRAPFAPGPVGLAWNPTTDTFFYLERFSQTLVEVDPAGQTLRTFPHPAPVETHLLVNRGLWVADERGALLSTTVSPGNPRRITRVVEIRLSGALSGFHIPLPAASGDAIVLDGGDLITISQARAVTDFLRLESLGDPDPGPTFLRGDANGSLDLNITDPVFLLNFLFLGGEAPICQDAADANDDGKLNVTDAIHTLQFLFLGGAPPPAPYPAPGLDPTSDALPCA